MIDRFECKILEKKWGSIPIINESIFGNRQIFIIDNFRSAGEGFSHEILISAHQQGTGEFYHTLFIDLTKMELP